MNIMRDYIKSVYAVMILLSLQACLLHAQTPELQDLLTPVPPHIQRIMANNAETFSEKKKAVNALSNSLKPNEYRALFAYLQDNTPAFDPLELKHIHVLKNNLMDILLAQKTPLSGMEDMLASIAHDNAQDVVIRDYAIQHLITWYPESSKKNDIEHLLWDMTGHAFGYAGTALIGLYRLSQTTPHMDVARIGRHALAVASDTNAHTALRISALQICGLTQEEAIKPLARTIAAAHTNIALRRSAIATLGQLDDFAFFDQLERKASPHAECSSAIDAAISACRENE